MLIRIQIYKPENTNFENNGDMTLMPTAAEVEVILNGSWRATLSHPIDDEGRWKYIEENAVIKMPSFNGDQLFRMKKKEKSDAGIEAEMEPIFMDAKDDCFLVDIRPTNKTGQQALDLMTAPNKKYTGKSNIKDLSTAYYMTKNLIEAINGEDENSFINRWGGEILFDNYTITINDHVGQNRGMEVLYGKNIAQDGMKEDVDIREVVTRIIPKAYNGYMIEGNEPWVDSSLIQKYPTIHYGVIAFEDVKMEEDASEDDEKNGVIICKTKEELKKALTEKCKEQYELGIDKPKINLSVDLVLLKDTELYKDVQDLEEVQIGDTIHCRHKKLDITTDARVIKLTYDSIQKKVAEVELGDFKYDYFDDVSSMTNRVESAIRPNGSVVGEQVQGILDGVKTQMQIQSSKAHKTTKKAFLAEDIDPDSETYGAMCWGSMGLMIADSKNPDGSWNWSTFGTGKGFFADYIVAGTMLFDRCKGGQLTLGGEGNGDGVAMIRDEQGNTIVILDKNGVYALGQYVCDSKVFKNKRVKLNEGSITFSGKDGDDPIIMGYDFYSAENSGCITVRAGGTETDATESKTLMRLFKDKTCFDAEHIYARGQEGQTGTAQFSNGTNLRFINGILIGGTTEEGAF